MDVIVPVVVGVAAFVGIFLAVAFWPNRRGGSTLSFGDVFSGSVDADIDVSSHANDGFGHHGGHSGDAGHCGDAGGHGGGGDCGGGHH